jgi:hypothetical protein
MELSSVKSKRLKSRKAIQQSAGTVLIETLVNVAGGDEQRTCNQKLKKKEAPAE